MDSTDLDKRMSHIEKKITKFEKDNKNSGNNNSRHNKSTDASSMIFNIAIELVAGLIVALIVGYMLDDIFTSKPIFLIICSILSFIAIFQVIWRKYIKK